MEDIAFFPDSKVLQSPAAFADLGLLFHYVTVVQGARLKGCKEIVDLASFFCSDFVGYRTSFFIPFLYNAICNLDNGFNHSDVILM